jgi:hypothetical protein
MIFLKRLDILATEDTEEPENDQHKHSEYTTETRSSRSKHIQISEAVACPEYL